MDNKKELEIQSFWKKNKTYEKTKASRKGAKKFFFMDGPPYATGFIHIGTGKNKVIKDICIRFWRMRGFDVWDQPGYDTHGLPIENKVEKLLKLKSKKDIEKYGIAKFNEQCKKFATQFIDVMNGEFDDMGIWMDWKNPYLTLSNQYIESAWHTFKIAYDKGLLHLGIYPVHVCPHCETAVAYNEIEYHKVSDPSIFIKFPMVDEKGTCFLVWTTTPWTLIANTGIMANPKAEYVKIKLEGTTEKLILAKDLVETVAQKMGKKYKIVDTFYGNKLEDLKYKHPFAESIPFASEIAQKGYRVVMSEQFVSLEDGTGLVHCAPGHGQEDFKVGSENALPIISPVNLNGTYEEKCGKFAFMFVKDADKSILEELRAKDMLLHEEKVVHDYPRCWRCESPLLFISVPQWFFKVTQIRDTLLAENEKVNWHPAWAKQRFNNWLENLADWPVSRQRYWGIPLPIWICDKCQKVKVIGSTDELPEVPADLHRPYIDSVKLKCECGDMMSRIHDVLDVWFDSGVASWASLNYPRDKTLFNQMWPADLNTEATDQFRGWWNSQIIAGVMTFGRCPFKNVLYHSFVLDARGSKMSKSKGNVTTPNDVIKKHGRDVLRFYYISTPPWDDCYFSWKNVDDIAKMLTIIENTYNFVGTYVPKISKADLRPEDIWILSRLHSTIQSVTENFETYNFHKVTEDLRNFIVNDFSRIYIKLIRDRVWPAFGGDAAAFYTLYELTKNTARMLAPITPYLSEHVQQNILKRLGENSESVHICSWPKPDKQIINKQMEEAMTKVTKIVEIANMIRQKNKMKLRWPLRGMVVDGDESVKTAVRIFDDVLKRLCNVKNVRFGVGLPENKLGEQVQSDAEAINLKVWLDDTMDEELRNEAMMREIVRKIQDMRKKMGLVITDKIVVSMNGCDPKVAGQYTDALKKEVGAKTILLNKVQGKKDFVEFNEKKIEIGIEKVK
ncbi:MAG: isoleucine--tRNA ligase [Candidatus Aenigmatarchaeota archaeon]